MKRTLHAVEVVTPAEAAEHALPEQVQVSLAEIASAEGGAACPTGTGLAVLHEAMEHEVEQVAGPRGRHRQEHTAYRHGRTGGRGIARRPPR